VLKSSYRGRSSAEASGDCQTMHVTATDKTFLFLRCGFINSLEHYLRLTRLSDLALVACA